jgi:UDP-glucose 4-epimerase
VKTIEDPLRADLVNGHGVVQVLEAARRAGVRRVIFAASAAAYGDGAELPKREDMTPRPLSPYAIAKVQGEQYLRVYASLHGMETVSLRYFNVFGPKQDPKGDYAAAIPRFVEAFVQRRQPTIYGDGEQTRDFCHIDDVVAANLAALAAPGLAGQIVNIARGESITIRDLVSLIARLCGEVAQPVFAPERPGDVKHSRADVSRAATLLGFRPAVTVEEGLRGTVAAFAAFVGGPAA